MSDSNSDEGPIGMKRLPQLSGVKVSKSVSKFAMAPPKAVAAPPKALAAPLEAQAEALAAPP